MFGSTIFRRMKKLLARLGPVKALPVVDAEIQNPEVTIGGKTIVLPVTLKTGEYLEFYAMDDCKHYGRDGELLGEIDPKGEVPQLRAGSNAVDFACGSDGGAVPRVRLTAIAYGGPYIDDFAMSGGTGGRRKFSPLRGAIPL